MVMRTLIRLVASLVGFTALAVGSSAAAAPSMSREWVPASALTPYRALTAAYADPSALGDGWVEVADLAGITCIADPAGSGAMGVHFANLDRLFDGVIDPSQPEAAVYEPRPNGTLHLVAFEYIVFQSQVSQAPELFPGHPFMATGANNRFGLPAYYSQHVWVGKGNPLGNLAMWNPAVHCS
jgi:hypothetical protein